MEETHRALFCSKPRLQVTQQALVISAAWTYDPDRAKGIDGALRTLLQQPYGKPLALAASAGLVVFGLYGLAEARYRRV